MDTTLERILLVGNDPEIEDLIVHQALLPLGYQIQKVSDVSTAIMEAARFGPDLVIADLNLPGLSGNDLLVALNSQGLQVPVIVIARKGEEQKVIQAFRLGAGDFLLWPVREAEVVAAVEHAVKQVRESRSRKRLDEQLKNTNQELQRRVRERHNRTFFLAAHRNLPEAWRSKLGQPLEDGISSLVALSGETLAINGEPLKRFRVSSLGESALVVPVKIQKKVIGLLVVVRKANQPFDKNMQSLLEAVTDYASVSLMNARLFRAIQESAEAAQLGEQNKLAELQATRKEIYNVLQPVTYPMELLLNGKMGKLSREQQEALKNVQDALQRAVGLVTTAEPPAPEEKD
jgi:FixJ family two-component response regulator